MTESAPVTGDENVKMKMMALIIAITDDGVGNVIDVGDENVKMKTMVSIHNQCMTESGNVMT
ncbi:hypothetical protein Tco_0449062, partial [Tanacetum coccineum]